MRISDWSSDVCSSDLRRPLKDLADAFLDAAAVGQVIAFVAPGEFFERWVLRTGEQELGVPVGRGAPGEHGVEFDAVGQLLRPDAEDAEIALNLPAAVLAGASGRPSRRERVCQCMQISVVGRSLKRN